MKSRNNKVSVIEDGQDGHAEVKFALQYFTCHYATELCVSTDAFGSMLLGGQERRKIRILDCHLHFMFKSRPSNRWKKNNGDNREPVAWEFFGSSSS